MRRRRPRICPSGSFQTSARAPGTACRVFESRWENNRKRRRRSERNAEAGRFRAATGDRNKGVTCLAEEDADLSPRSFRETEAAEC